MHTLEDEKVIQEYENYIEKNGTDDEVLSKYIKAIEIVIVGREDREYGLKISSRVKKLIEKVVFDNSEFVQVEGENVKSVKLNNITDFENIRDVMIITNFEGQGGLDPDK